MVLVPDPSYPTKRSFWSALCSRYSGTDLPAGLFTSSSSVLVDLEGTGSDKNAHTSFVPACKVIYPDMNLQKKFIQIWMSKLENLRDRWMFISKLYLSPYITFRILLPFFLVRSIFIHPKMWVTSTLYTSQLQISKEKNYILPSPSNQVQKVN